MHRNSLTIKNVDPSLQYMCTSRILSSVPDLCECRFPIKKISFLRISILKTLQYFLIITGTFIAIAREIFIEYIDAKIYSILVSSYIQSLKIRYERLVFIHIYIKKLLNNGAENIQECYAECSANSMKSFFFLFTFLLYNTWFVQWRRKQK